MIKRVTVSSSNPGLIRLGLAVVLVLTLSLSPFVAHAADNPSTASQFFPQTGHSVSDKFLAFWQNNGGLSIFGYPITDAQNEIDPHTGKTFLTQWFERSRFELHPENAGTPYEVELGLLGRDLTSEAQGVDPAFQPARPGVVSTFFGPPQYYQTYQYVPETSHNIAGEFLQFWADHGGAAVFGLPISEPFSDFGLNGVVNTNNAPVLHQVQWFERARFELYVIQSAPQPPSKPGGPISEPKPSYQVRLSLLGNEVKGLTTPDQYMWHTAVDQINFYNYGTALDSAGNIFVSDRSGNYVTKFDQNGNQLEQWKTHEGDYPNGYGWPLQIAIDTHDNVFIADSGNDYIKKFDLHGKLLVQWGGGGSQDGHLLNPLGIAVDNSGNVYVADTGNDRIQKFDSDGHFLTKWGTRGGYDGQLIGPEGLTVDNQGHVFVADTYDNLIVKFDSNGKFLQKWGGYGSDTGKFKAPRTLVMDKAGNLFVLEARDNYNNGNNRIQKFDSNGKFLATWDSYGLANDKFLDARGLAIDSAGNLYLADSNQRVLKYNNMGKFLAKFSTFPASDGKFREPIGGALDTQGNLYVTDSGNNRVQKLDNQGRFLLKWGSSGNADGQFEHPTGIATDAMNNVYVADNDNLRIQKFDSQGHFLLKWGSSGSDDGQFLPPLPPPPDKNYPYPIIPSQIGGLAVDSAGNVYVADTGNNRIQKFDSQGHFLLKWETTPYNDGKSPTLGTPVGNFPYAPGPVAIAIDKANNVFVVSNADRPVLKYDSNGHLLNNWKVKNQAYFSPSPMGVTLDKAGNVYITNTYDQSIQKFDGNGNLLQVFGQPSDGYTYPHSPFQGFVIDNADHIFLMDYMENYIVKYRQH